MKEVKKAQGRWYGYNQPYQQQSDVHLFSSHIKVGLSG